MEEAHDGVKRFLAYIVANQRYDVFPPRPWHESNATEARIILSLTEVLDAGPDIRKEQARACADLIVELFQQRGVAVKGMRIDFNTRFVVQFFFFI